MPPHEWAFTGVSGRLKSIAKHWILGLGIFKPMFHVEIKLKNFRLESPPSVDRPKIIFISGVVPL